MKFSFAFVCVSLFLTLLPATLYAKEIVDYRVEAEQYYSEQNFKKAFKIYHKLAKMGDHPSQAQLAVMYSKGEGKAVDFTEAYAWSVVASENGDEMQLKQSEELSLHVTDKTKAEKRAARLMKKYGQKALEEKAIKRATRLRNHEMGGCTGSRVGCSGG